MAIVKCELDEQERGIKTDQDDRGAYEKFWKVVVDDENHAGLSVLEMARQVTAPNDPVPNHGDQYSFLDATDNGSYALGFECNLIDKEDPLNWYVKVDYKRLPQGKSSQQVQEKNPLKWDPEYWLEFVEEQIPIEDARCLGIWKVSEIDPSKFAWFSLEAIKRGPLYAQTEGDPEYDPNSPIPTKNKRLAKPGPIVNSAGQQTVDPQTMMDFRTIICAQINLRSYLDAVALTGLWKRSTNSDWFLGAPPRSWKFLGAIPDKRQEKEVPGVGTVVYYPCVVKLEYKPEQDAGLQNGWDLKLLNNGQVSPRRVISNGVIQDSYILDPQTQKPALIPVEVRRIKDTAIDKLDADPDTILTEDDFEWTEASEPINLNWDGRPLSNPEDKAQHIQYRYLEDKKYTDMTYNNGFRQASIW